MFIYQRIISNMGVLMYKKILVAVDGSDLSYIAFDHAITLAGLAKGELTILYVMENQIRLTAPFESTEVSMAMRLVEKGKTEMAERMLNDYMEKGKARDVKMIPLMLKGNVANEIIKASADFDVTIIGSLGGTTLKSLFLGSNAEKVARHAHGHVMLIRDIH